ncbi:MAG: hypothetical protein OXD37_00875 [Acidimicrobiaceae bacterium]|nr:hypothetical protein [Acidimicrobiaceae bacterium]
MTEIMEFSPSPISSRPFTSGTSGAMSSIGSGSSVVAGGGPGASVVVGAAVVTGAAVVAGTATASAVSPLVSESSSEQPAANTSSTAAAKAVSQDVFAAGGFDMNLRRHIEIDFI